MYYKIRRITAIGLLIAAEVVLSRFLSIATPVVKIGFAFVPVVVAAALYGPLWAGAAAAIADALGAILFPIGAYFFGFTFTAFLTGVAFGLFLYGRPFKFLNGALAALIVCGALNFVLDTFWLYIIMREGVWAFIPARAVKAVVMLAVQTVSIGLILKLCAPVIDKTVSQRKRALSAGARAFWGDAKARETLSAGITGRVLALGEYESARTIFCFVGTGREPDTREIIEAALASGKRVCAPRCESAAVMTAREITSLSQLAEGRFGLMEPPEAARVVDKAEIDLALVPCTLCGRDFNRIGNAGGYYDAYLAGAAFPKAALCPAALLERRVPALEHDVPMDIIVTENEVLRRSK